MSGKETVVKGFDDAFNGTSEHDVDGMRLGGLGERPGYKQRESESALLADGFEEALVGIGTHFTTHVAVYDYEKCVEILCSEGLSEEEALEHMEYNVTGGWVGPNTPVFIRYRKLADYLDVLKDEEEMISGERD